MGRLKEIKDRLAAEQDTESKKWQQEIESLERRTRQYRDIDLGDGSKISILERLPESLEQEFGDFRKKWGEAERKDKEGALDPREKEKLEYELFEWLAVLCQNPLLTAEYFAENKDRYSSEDILTIIFAYYGGLAQRVEEQVQKIEKRTTARKFRQE